MNETTPSSLLRRSLLACLATLTLLISLSANAGSISFGLSLDGGKIIVTNHGNSSAYYPSVLRLLADGRWETLSLPAGVKQPAELPPGAQLELMWPDTRPLESMPPLEALRPIMVRFFDQAGSGFGQISFFNQPQQPSETLEAGYVKGEMKITPPKGNAIRATWVLWPQEEGIAALNKPVRFDHTQPPAKKIEWRPNMEAVRLNLGKGLPIVHLLHETSQGYTQQIVSDGNTQGRQQRTAWLNADATFYRLAKFMGAAGVAILLWLTWTTWLKRRTV